MKQGSFRTRRSQTTTEPTSSSPPTGNDVEKHPAASNWKRLACYLGASLLVAAAVHVNFSEKTERDVFPPTTPAPTSLPTPTPTLDAVYTPPPILIVLRETNNVQLRAAHGGHLIGATVSRAAAVSPDSKIIVLHNQRHKRHADMANDDFFGALLAQYPQLETRSVAGKSSERSTFLVRHCNRARFDSSLGWGSSSSSSSSGGGGGDPRNAAVGGSLCSSQALRRLLVAVDFAERTPEIKEGGPFLLLEAGTLLFLSESHLKALHRRVRSDSPLLTNLEGLPLLPPTAAAAAAAASASGGSAASGGSGHASSRQQQQQPQQQCGLGHDVALEASHAHYHHHRLRLLDLDLTLDTPSVDRGTRRRLGSADTRGDTRGGTHASTRGGTHGDTHGGGSGGSSGGSGADPRARAPPPPPRPVLLTLPPPSTHSGSSVFLGTMEGFEALIGTAIRALVHDLGLSSAPEGSDWWKQPSSFFELEKGQDSPFSGSEWARFIASDSSKAVTVPPRTLSLVAGAVVGRCQGFGRSHGTLPSLASVSLPVASSSETSSPPPPPPPSPVNAGNNDQGANGESKVSFGDATRKLVGGGDGSSAVSAAHHTVHQDPLDVVEDRFRRLLAFFDTQSSYEPRKYAPGHRRGGRVKRREWATRDPVSGKKVEHVSLVRTVVHTLSHHQQRQAASQAAPNQQPQPQERGNQDNRTSLPWSAPPFPGKPGWACALTTTTTASRSSFSSSSSSSSSNSASVVNTSCADAQRWPVLACSWVTSGAGGGGSSGGAAGSEVGQGGTVFLLPIAALPLTRAVVAQAAAQAFLRPHHHDGHRHRPRHRHHHQHHDGTTAAAAAAAALDAGEGVLGSDGGGGSGGGVSGSGVESSGDIEGDQGGVAEEASVEAPWGHLRGMALRKRVHDLEKGIITDQFNLPSKGKWGRAQHHHLSEKNDGASSSAGRPPEEEKEEADLEEDTEEVVLQFLGGC